MKALGKLVATNDVDLTLFVGEALVGNDSVDQLTKFNLAVRFHIFLDRLEKDADEHRSKSTAVKEPVGLTESSFQNLIQSTKKSVQQSVWYATIYSLLIIITVSN